MTRSARRGRVVALFALALVELTGLTGPAHGSGAAEPAAGALHDGIVRVEGTLPGPVLDLTAHRDAGGRGVLMLLVRPVGGEVAPAQPCLGETPGVPLELWRLTPPGEAHPDGALERLRNDIAPGTQRLGSFRLSGSGAPALLAAAPGMLSALPDDGGQPATVLDDSLLKPRSARLVQAAEPPRTLLVASGLGKARLYRSGGEDGSWDSLLDMDLHKYVVPGGHGLRLSAVPPEYAGEAGGAQHFATPPVALSKRRLRGQWLSVDAAGARLREFWAGLPEPEEVLESRFIVLGERPALFVTTRPADKLSLFGEKRLRLFRLEEDRSRMGHPPFFAVQTHANLWQSITPYVRDVDGDGVDDLVLAYWKGLKDDRIVLDVYRGTAEGGLRRTPQTTAFDVKDGDRSFLEFGGDIDGDDVPDLLLRSAGRLLVFSGKPAADRGRALVATRPTHTIPLGGGAEGDEEDGGVVIRVGSDGVQTDEAVGGPPRPQLVELRGDGRNAIVNLAPLADGTLRLTLIVLE